MGLKGSLIQPLPNLGLAEIWRLIKHIDGNITKNERVYEISPRSDGGSKHRNMNS